MNYTFHAPGDNRVFVLTYARETRVLDSGLRRMSVAAAARELGDGCSQADADQAAWGRVILSGRQDGHDPLVRRYTIAAAGLLRDLSDRDFEALVAVGGLLP